MFGVLMTNFGVYGQSQETALYIPQGLYHEGTAINGQKLGEAISSQMHSLKRVFDISFGQKRSEREGLDGIFAVTFSIETNGGRIFDVGCEARVSILVSSFASPPLLALYRCRNEALDFRNTIYLSLQDISDDEIPSQDIFFKNSN